MNRRFLATTALPIFVVTMLFLHRACSREYLGDPVAVARAETSMWKAYYSGDSRGLGTALMELQTEQFRLDTPTAFQISIHLARAAMTFRSGRGGYDQDVMPDLEEAYRLLKDATDLPFDPRQAAQAELAWWVARRDPKSNRPEQVGHRIALLYAEIFGKQNQEIEQAGLLRARAAALRDSGRGTPDWETIQSLLVQSYEHLSKGVAS